MGRLLSHRVGRGIRRNAGLPSAEPALEEVPQPWGLAAPSQGLFPVGPGEDDSAPREERETRPAQVAQGRAGSQAGSGTENRLECLSYVPCPSAGARTGAGGGDGHPRALQAELPRRSRVRLSGMSRGTKQKQGRGRNWTPFIPGDQGQLEALGLVPEQGRADRRAGQMLELTFPVRWRPEDTLPLQTWALPGPLKEWEHSSQGNFAEPCTCIVLWRRCQGEARCCP